jgi:hypothetical protein
MASVVEAIVHCFTVGMSPDANARRGAEGELARLEGSVPQFSLHVLQVIDLATQPEPIRQAAAVYFKNMIKRCWVVIEEEGVEQRNILSPEERGLIKVNLVSLMLKSPESIQKQLMEAISLISEADYPKQWLTLLPELIEKLSQANGDYRVINGILNTIYSIFKKYRNTLINDTEKVTELKYSIVTFAPKLLELFKVTFPLSLSLHHLLSPTSLSLTFTPHSLTRFFLLALVSHLFPPLLFSSNKPLLVSKQLLVRQLQLVLYKHSKPC